jgi:hypothetical protein
MLETGSKQLWMTEFAYLDESLDINQTQSYHLSIQLGLNGLSFCILDTVTRKYIALRHYPFTDDEDQRKYASLLQPVIEKDELLQKPFKSSAVIIESFKSVFIPSSLFKKEEKETYFSFNHHTEDGDHIFSDKLSGPDAWCLYAIQEEISDFFSHSFADIRQFHHTRPFIEGIFKHPGVKEKEAAIYLLIHDTFFDVAVVHNHKLILFNTFKYRQVNDMVYIILYVIQMLQLDQHNVPIVLQGKVNIHSSLLGTLKRYVQHVSLAKRNSSYTYSYKFNTIPEHTFANLFNVHPCV